MTSLIYVRGKGMKAPPRSPEVSVQNPPEMRVNTNEKKKKKRFQTASNKDIPITPPPLGPQAFATAEREKKATGSRHRRK